MRAIAKKVSPGMLVVASLIIAAIAVYASDGSTVNYSTTQQITGPDGICKKVTNNSGTGLSEYIPTASVSEWQSFTAHPPAGVTLAACPTSGSPQCYTTSGSFPFTVPTYNTLTVQVWGGGGGGSPIAGGSLPTDGGQSWIELTPTIKAMWANGGTASNGALGAGGTASGGSTNTTGNPGTVPNGGNAPNGGVGGGANAPGGAPGAGGGGTDPFGGGGGSGGYSTITYTAGGSSPAQGATITAVVGAGGNPPTPGLGAGAPGAVCFSWN